MSEIDELLRLAEDAVLLAEQEEQSAAERANAARAERDTIQRLVSRYRSGGEASEVPDLGDAHQLEWDDLYRPDAILRLLEERGEAMSPRQISAALGELGREYDPPELVSSAINKLRHRRLVISPKHGYWRAAALSENGNHPQELVEAY